MNIGMIGLGHLGLPVAVAIAANRNHCVIGNDLNPERMSYRPQDYQEQGVSGGDFNHTLEVSPMEFGTLEEVVGHAEILFVAVQTPHEPEYEGITALPEERRDFDYSYLETAIADIAKVVDPHPDTKPLIVAVISTVLPGTMARLIKPLCTDNMVLVYNPLFIAMGSVIPDYLRPEFVLIGGSEGCSKMARFYKTITETPPFLMSEAPTIIMSIESAELTKVAYNTFISTKLAFVNTLLEVAHKCPGVNVEDVTGTLMKATDRIISPAYMTPGMGDGGGCHPRDNIALSWLARKLDMGYDFFEAIMLSREHQARWLAGMMNETGLPPCILGYAFKLETNITTGSHALLVDEFLNTAPLLVDPHVCPKWDIPETPHVFLIGMDHPEFEDYRFPMGSVVIDPWRYIPDQEGVTVIRLGE